MKKGLSKSPAVDKCRRPIVFVSSSVYDKEDFLSSLSPMLYSLGYEPWLSLNGSFPISHKRSAFGNCLEAVRRADFFIGIISPWYGSGVDEGGGVSITHMEMREARDSKIPRLLLVDRRVVDLKVWLDSLGFKGQSGRQEFKKMLGTYRKDAGAYLEARKTCDIRAVDLYDEMTLGEPNDVRIAASRRVGNWVQGFRDIDEVKSFLAMQFSYLQNAEEYLGYKDGMSRIQEKMSEIRYAREG